jgi:membrane complex biogenesis BtpA family protein
MSARPVARTAPTAVRDLFGRAKVAIGVVHALPLPGAPDHDGRPMAEIAEHALDEAERYRTAGFDGLVVENHGDIPFLKPDDIGQETVAAMAVLVHRVRAATALPVGVSVLANGALPALAVAAAGEAQFVRVNQWANAYVANEGIVEGPAAKALRYRARLGAKAIRVFADVHVKHGAHAITADRSIEELARDNEFFHADAAIATGQRTGDAATIDELATIKAATVLPVLVGSGVAVGNVGDILAVADGVIVASSLKRDGVWWNRVDPDRAAAFMTEVRRVR